MAIGLKFKPTTDELTGQSKWWGAPDLPEGWEYPCQDGNPLTSLPFDSDPEPPKFDEYPAFVEVDGKTYYYLDEDTVAYGFQKIGDYFYYFSTTDGAMRTGEYTVQAYTSNSYLEEARAFFFHETYGRRADHSDRASARGRTAGRRGPGAW